ncbi:acetyl-CoA synthetase [Roseiarcus fermentans]|uniref:Acetyl-CoA synthetase n=1 Tax=Roseiarcus fermentans TaxID=1473586 RepID=A0A366FKY2_9HYPH|nr:AMP-binding protein [Roseiarcus fermentans]RBP14385.1 acetyl-CoA synthetase [Roseiarcus fermentans]
MRFPMTFSTQHRPGEHTPTFREARDLLLALDDRYMAAKTQFAWPRPARFNWALDWFDAEFAGGDWAARTALKIVGETVQIRSFGELSRESSRLANGLRTLGARRGDRLLMMLGACPELWVTMLASIKLGLVLMPAMPQLSPLDIVDRLERGRAKFLIAHGSDAGKFAEVETKAVRIAVGAAAEGWRAFDQLLSPNPRFQPDGPTDADDPMLLYFTSGTTARSKLVVHSHASYPIGHLSTMYGLGLKPGDIHLNISSPGWAKHAWSSVFAPWNAGATVVALAQRFEPGAALDALAAHGVTTFCAPPTVWRMLVQADLGARKADLRLREIMSSGEPLNPEVIDQVRRAWGLTLRDSYGQTETTMMVANSPGQRVIPGSMGRPLPGYRIVLLDSDGLESDHGEIALPLRPRPVGLMSGYADDTGGPAPVGGAYFRTGDVASRNAEGYLTYVGRADDVFKSSDYRLSPFELESALIEHEAVVEAAVVPAPDPVRFTTPKAYVVLAEGFAPDAATAAAIFAHVRERLSPYKRVRRIEFAELPKTASGKIRRVELRARETDLAEKGERAEREFRIEDFSEG